MPNKPSRWLVVLAFAAIYFIWGSAYIGIHFAIETLPPFLMTGTRFLIAGGVLMLWARLRGAPAPTRIEWRSALIIGFLLFMIQNGSVVWAVGHGVPSGMVAVLTASIPLFMVLLAWGSPGGRFPGVTVIGGVLLGLFGIILLVSPSGTTSFNLVGVGAVLVGAFCWAYGSLYSKRAPLPKSINLSTGMQLFCGGVFQMIASILTGDAATLDLANVSTLSLVAVVYLGIISSVIGFSAYSWLLRVEPPARVSTYAYVNPVVAVSLGWLLASEPVTLRTIIASAIIITSVIIINSSSYRHLSRFRPTKVTKAAEATP